MLPCWLFLRRRPAVLVACRRFALLTLVAALVGTPGLGHFPSPLARAADDEAALSPGEIDSLLKAVGAVRLQGEGSAAAREARDRLAAAGPAVLPPLLHVMDAGHVVAANWYRTVYDDVVERELASDRGAQRLPVADLKQIAADPRRGGPLRRLVWQTLDRIEPEFGPALLPTLTDDPEFREDAVQHVLAQAEQARKDKNDDAARAAYRKAFASARDSAQVLRAVRGLRALGDEASAVQQMGFIVQWRLAGPWDAPGYSGFAAVFPPEEQVAQDQVDLAATYPGQGGRTIEWKPYRTKDDLGQLNLIQAVAPVKEAVAYAYCEIDSPRDQEVQLRCGADDNCSVWVNGRKIFARDQWLNGTRLDRFRAPATLVKGRNTVLVKICQGPSHVNPEVPNNWSLQLRFCDASGAGVPFQVTLPADGEFE